MNNTEKMNLALPSGSDYVDIETLNENFRKIDVHTHTPEEVGAAITFTRIVDVGTDWIQEGDDGLGFWHQRIAVEGVTSDDYPRVDIVSAIGDKDTTKVFEDCLDEVFHIEMEDGKIWLFARSEITTAFQIILTVVR